MHDMSRIKRQASRIRKFVDRMTFKQIDRIYSMTKADFQKQFQERVAPMLQEMGVEGFVIAGYMTDGERKFGRFALSVTTNPMAEDGLLPLTRFAAMWSAPAAEFAPPPPLHEDHPGGSA